MLAIEECSGEKLSLFEWKWKTNANPKKRVHFSSNEKSGEENSKQVCVVKIHVLKYLKYYIWKNIVAF